MWRSSSGRWSWQRWLRLLLFFLMMMMMNARGGRCAGEASQAMEELHMPDFSDQSNISIVSGGGDGWYTTTGGGGGGAQYSNSTGAMFLTPIPIPTRTHNFNNASSTSSSSPSSFTGRFIYRHPLHLLRSPSFNTSFVFRLFTSSHDYNLPPPPCSTSFFFTISDFLQSPPHILGNDAADGPPKPAASHSYLSVQFDSNFHEPRGCHIAINVGSITSVNVSDDRDGPREGHQLYRDFCLDGNSTYKAWVEYNNATHLISVWLAPAGALAQEQIRPAEPPLLQYNYDLTSVMKDSMFAGFSGTSYIDDGCSGVGIAVFSWDLATGISLSSDSTDPRDGGHDHRRAARNGALAAATAGSVVVVVVLITLSLRRRKATTPPGSVDGGGGVMRMRYSALCKATGGFSDRNKIGEGAFGVVYKGELPDGSTVAVKRLKKSMRRDEEFATEMNVIGSIRHRNLLEMKGWCYERGEAVLVYDYMSNGSLDGYLFGDARISFVRYASTEEEGKTRLSILTDVAAALSYLHSSLGKCVLHRDVKAANVLLTANMEARLADFGMARLVQHDQSVMPSLALGTAGYIAPEVMVTAKISDKSDVYGFGVLMLETACGRRAISGPMCDRQRKIVEHSKGGRSRGVAEEEAEEEAQHVVAHVAQHLRGGKMSAGLHPSLRQGEEWKWVEVLYMGLACCQYSAAARPSMTDVHRMLQNLRLAKAPADMVLPMWSSLALHQLATDVLLPHSTAAASSGRWFDSSIFESSSLLLLPRPP